MLRNMLKATFDRHILPLARSRLTVPVWASDIYFSCDKVQIRTLANFEQLYSIQHLSNVKIA